MLYLVALTLRRNVWVVQHPTGTELRGIEKSNWDHLRLRFNHTRRYNVLQDDIPDLLIDDAETVDDAEHERLMKKAKDDGLEPTVEQ